MADHLPEGKDDQKKSSSLPVNRAGTMNKTQLAAGVARQAGLSQKVSAKVVEAVLASITSSLKSGEEVRLVGFGSFSVTHRKASMGRNPRTGEGIQITALNQPKFKAGKSLKDAVN
ncbi:MAG: HU family DNA-binding protein [Alphaproteobacteria bacterium]|nr:HU family DNA-binding protein [Alphaproteobacteria bacterium]